MALTLAELEAYDPQAPPARGNQRRYCCPLGGPCEGKPIDAAHRSLCVNQATGQWTCQRCHSVGILGEFRPSPEPRWDRQRARLREAFSVPPPHEPPRTPDTNWRAELGGVVALAGTAGAAYLTRRGIPVDLASKAGVRFAANWYGRPAVVFPVRDRAGSLVAAAGRYVDEGKPKTRDAGEKRRGVFAPPEAWEADPLVIVEGSLDALSLAAAEIPAVALLGCALSDAAAWACALRLVAVALDADAAGDAAAGKLHLELTARGCRGFRLRPGEGKDWNDMLLELGPEGLAKEVRDALTSRETALSSDSGASWGPGAVSDRSGQEGPQKPDESAPEWTPEEQRVYDAELGACAAALSDIQLIEWVRERFGCVLSLDERGGLRAENKERVPGPVREEVRGRARLLVARLKRRG